MNLNEIKAALSKATPGPWKSEGGTFERGDKRPAVITYFDTDHGEWFIHGDIADKDDAYLIANAPQWLASLVSEVEVWEETSIKLHKKLELQSTIILEMQKTLEDLKMRMQDGHKNGYESETIFWTRCIWEIDQALKEDKPNDHKPML